MATPLTTQKRISINVRMLMALRGLKPADITAALALNPRTVTLKFSGKARWSVDDLEVLVDLLDCDQVDLTGDPARVLHPRATNSYKSPSALLEGVA